MLRWVRVWLLALLALVIAVGAAGAQDKRIALLIGNRGYQPAVGELKNPHNDIELMGGALKAIGFQNPTLMKDARRSQILVAVRQYAARLAAAGPGAIGFLYYSGHGAAEQGTNTNYLIPVDATDPNSASFWDESVRLEEITRLMLDRAPQAAHFVVFDACRNELRLSDKTASKGFATVATLRGMFVAFASEFGRTASDSGDRSGPYAAALAAELVKPGQSHLDLFQNVKEAVARQTGGRQSPWELNGLSQRVHLVPAAASPAPPPLAVPAASPRVSEAAEAWDRVKGITSIVVLEAFADRYKDTFYSELARARIDELKRQAVAVAAPPTAPAPPARCDGVEVTVGAGNERRCLKPGAGKTDWFEDCPECPEMVIAPAGRFTMGSPTDELEPFEWEDQVSVTIAKPLAVGRFAVTRGEFAAFVAATGHKTDGGCQVFMGTEWKLQADASWRSVGFGQTDRHPVVCVNWNDAKAYAEWLSKATGKSYRLLSESEREYVARAGTTTPFWWGSTISTGQANYNGDHVYASGAKGEYRKVTVAVDSFSANPWGLYNVHGNVWEWAEDCWNDKNSGKPGSGSARTSGDCGSRVLRGGSWKNVPQYLRSAHRFGNSPVNRDDNLGFRVARTL
jgi:formylglycine-generating enzyme required for sulfatase activity